MALPLARPGHHLPVVARPSLIRPYQERGAFGGRIGDRRCLCYLPASGTRCLSRVAPPSNRRPLSAIGPGDPIGVAPLRLCQPRRDRDVWRAPLHVATGRDRLADGERARVRRPSRRRR